MKEETRAYFLELFENNKGLGYRKIFNLWKRIEYRRRNLL